MSFLPNEIEERLRTEIDRRGLLLLDLKRHGQHNTTVVEVVVDNELEGVSLDTIADLSRWIGALFDEDEKAIPGHYRLEVSLAGIDRPLEHSWQFRKNTGRLINITFDDESGVRKIETFRLLDNDNGVLKLGPKAKKAPVDSQPVIIPIERVIRAVVEPEF